jgi:hypothetical protein
LSIVHEPFIGNLFTWEAEVDILAFEAFEDSSIFALETSQQQISSMVAYKVI